jgi:TRAP-type C4-dicarboxylate transport system permease large subunit
MVLLQEAIAGGLFLLQLALVVLAIIVLVVIFIYFAKKQNSATDKKDLSENGNIKTAEKRKPSLLFIIIFIGFLVGIIVFGNWLCNFKYD